MQGHNIITILLIICHALGLSVCDPVIEEGDNNSVHIELIDTNIHNHRKLPIFPKNTKKFVITPTPPNDILHNHKPTEKIRHKITLMPRFKPKLKVETIATTKMPRRKPLMKLRTFTIKSQDHGNLDKTKEELLNDAHVTKANTRRSSIHTTKNPVMEIQDSTEIYLPEEQTNDEKYLKYITNSEDQLRQGKKDEEAQRKMNSHNFVVDEEQDRKEFIFLEKEDQKHVVEMLDSISQELDEDIEATTDIKLIKSMARVKRNKNIIEEEHMGSTVSGFKYTGRDTKMNNNFYFKNINS